MASHELDQPARDCRNCRKQARLMNPRFHVTFRSNLTKPQLTKDTEDLVKIIQSDDVFTIALMAHGPGQAGYVCHDRDLPPSEVRSWTAKRFDKWAISTIAARLHPVICTPAAHTED